MLTIQLFNRFSATSDTTKIKVRDGSKAQELISYLLINADCPKSRDSLADLLWSECTTEVAKKYLRKTLWQIRSAFRAAGLEFRRYSEVEDDWILFISKDVTWCDLFEFNRAFKLATGMKALNEQSARELQSAFDMHGNGFLPNHYQDWCVAEKDILRRQQLILCDRLLDYYIADEDPSRVINLATQVLRIDASYERAHQVLMWIYAVYFDRTCALSQFSECRRALDSELGVEPSNETKTLHERIQKGDIGTSFTARSTAQSALVSPVFKRQTAARHQPGTVTDML